MHVYMALKEMEEIATLVECRKYMKVVTTMWCLRVWMMYELICIQFGYIKWMSMIGIYATSQICFNFLQNKLGKPLLPLLLLCSHDKELGSQERYCPCREPPSDQRKQSPERMSLPCLSHQLKPSAPQEMGQEHEPVIGHAIWWGIFAIIAKRYDSLNASR
jgi:hypothetical protein